MGGRGEQRRLNNMSGGELCSEKAKAKEEVVVGDRVATLIERVSPLKMYLDVSASSKPDSLNTNEQAKVKASTI
jgi:hypothetical protein